MKSLNMQYGLHVRIFKPLMETIYSIQGIIEKNAFGVCTRLGEKLRIPTYSIRVLFIYSSFIAFGSPLLLYLGLAFVMNFRKHMRRRDTLWYY
ncbi:MAG: PspC family transcriptional regulator [Bacteroidota bacterium]